MNQNCTPYMHQHGKYSVVFLCPEQCWIINWWHLEIQLKWILAWEVSYWQLQLLALDRLLQVWVHLLSSVVVLCKYSSIHDHTDSHCFLKMLQGNLKETLFAWPDKKSNEMIKKSERILRENQCAYINGNIQYIFLTSGENLAHPSEILLSYICAVERGSWRHDLICLGSNIRAVGFAFFP